MISGMFGCAGMLALIALPFGLIGALFVREAGWRERLLLACMPSAMTFVAALLLMGRDHLSNIVRISSVRRKLQSRRDVTAAEFVEPFPDCEPALLADIRQAIAEFFAVPPEKIHPTDDLQNDYLASFNGAPLHSAVMSAVFEARGVWPGVKFRPDKLKTVGDLARKIQRSLERHTQRPEDREGDDEEEA